MDGSHRNSSFAPKLRAADEVDAFRGRSGWPEGVQEIHQEVQSAATWIPSLQTEMARVVVGQRYLVDRLIVGLLTNGHLLLEGVPGLAKTLALKTLAETLAGAKFRRLQFTPDMLPADVVGTMIGWLRAARRLSSTLYDFAGLRAFKAKLRPHA